MANKAFPCAQVEIRGTDSNSLLRMYDAAREVASTSGSQLERAQADRAVRRIAQELQKRRVSP